MEARRERREREKEQRHVQEKEDAKAMRQILSQMTKMQNTIKDLAERQEQILDRMSLMEQRGEQLWIRTLMTIWNAWLTVEGYSGKD